MRCLRTWQATDMAGMANDSLGTFFLMAENNATELAAGTSKLHVGVSRLLTEFDEFRIKHFKTSTSSGLKLI